MTGEEGPLPAVIDASVPHPARRYNYWLAGKDNFAELPARHEINIWGAVGRKP